MRQDEYIEGWRGLCVAMGLGKPNQRGACAAVATGTVAYVAKFPSHAFREDGSIRPLNTLSAAPDAVPITHHFLLTPLVVGAAAFLFT